MLKKLNQKLLVNFPLLWNTKFFNITLFMLLVHVISFVVGFSSIQTIRHIVVHSGYRHFLKGLDVMAFQVLIICIAVLVWLIFYLRNNPFKSFYPVSRNYLRKEFLLIWLIFFITTTIFHSYQYGYHMRFLLLTRDCQPAEERELLTQANIFLPRNIDDYELMKSCDSLAAKAAREAAREKVLPDDDSCDRYPYDGMEYSYDANNEADSLAAILAREESMELARLKQYSYLYYCRGTYYDFAMDEEQSTATAKRWLLNNRRDSIRQLLQDYVNLMERYQLLYNFNVDTVASWPFATPEHAIYNTLSDAGGYNLGLYQVEYNAAEFSALSSVISEVDQERDKTFWNLSNWLVYGYVSLGLSIILLMFRITRLRPWLISIVCVGIWAILFGLCHRAGEENLSVAYIMLIAACFCASIAMILRKGQKLFSAIFLLWFAFGFLVVTPIIFWLIERHTHEIRECIGHIWKVTRPEHPIHAWINDNWVIINSANIGLGFLVILFIIIPLAYRWQSNPAE